MFTYTLLRVSCTALVALLAALVGVFVRNLFIARLRIRRYQKQGLPVPPHHSFLFGHLLLLREIRATMPKDAHMIFAFGEMCRRYFPEQGLCYVDIWPLGDQTIAVTSPAVAHQTTQVHRLIKPPSLRSFFRPLTGGVSLFEMPDALWKPWRAVYNKGFSTAQVSALTPRIVDECVVFRDILRDRAQEGKMFLLEPVTLRLSMDIVGWFTLNTGLGSQRGYSTLADRTIDQGKLHVKGAATVNPLEYFNFCRQIRQWWNARQIDAYLLDALDRRYNDYSRARAAEHKKDPSRPSAADRVFGKSMLDLLLQAYVTKSPPPPVEMPSPYRNQYTNDLKGQVASNDGTAGGGGDVKSPVFRAFATSMLRTFVLAGTGATSSAMCYILHLLATHPVALERVRSEHDAVFGRDLARLPQLIAAEPQLLTALPYTDAVIKECLRLYPPAASSRQGAPAPEGLICVCENDGDKDDGGARESYNVGVNRGDMTANGSKDGIPGGARPDGSRRMRCYPTEGVNLWLVHAPAHRDPVTWGPRAHEFVPERWLLSDKPGSLTSTAASPSPVAAAAAAAAASEAAELFPPSARGAWRPFEQGPRMCPGQAFAMAELRVFVALLVREFDLAPAYEEWDAARGEAELSRIKGPVRTLPNGERAYMADAVAARPVDEYPCRVALNPAYMKG